MTTPTLEQDFYTPEELAELWGFHYRTILNYIADGDIRAFKVRGQWRISRESVREAERKGMNR